MFLAEKTVKNSSRDCSPSWVWSDAPRPPCSSPSSISTAAGTADAVADDSTAKMTPRCVTPSPSSGCIELLVEVWTGSSDHPEGRDRLDGLVEAMLVVTAGRPGPDRRPSSRRPPPHWVDARMRSGHHGERTRSSTLRHRGIGRRPTSPPSAVFPRHGAGTAARRPQTDPASTTSVTPPQSAFPTAPADAPSWCARSGIATRSSANST